MASPSWKISDTDRNRWLGTFNSLRPNNGKIGGNEARGCFMMSGLPVEILGKVWQLADIDKDGHLIFEEFLIAMYLIDSKLKLNIQIPDSVPLALIESIKSFSATPTQSLSTNPAQYKPQPQPTPQTNHYATRPTLAPTQPTPTVSLPIQTNTNAPNVTGTNPQAQGYQFFSVEDIESHKKLFDPLVNMSTGFKLGGQQALQFFSQAGLPQNILGAIWALSDTDKDGALSFSEFCTMMYFCTWKTKEGANSEVPTALPLSFLTQLYTTIEKHKALAKPPTGVDIMQSTLAKLLDQNKQRNQAVLQQGLVGIQMTQQQAEQGKQLLACKAKLYEILQHIAAINTQVIEAKELNRKNAKVVHEELKQLEVYNSAIAQMKLASEMLSARQALITDKFSQLQETGDELKRQRQEAYAQHQHTTADTDNDNEKQQLRAEIDALLYRFGQLKQNLNEYDISRLPEEVQIEIAKDLSLKEDRIYHMPEDEKIKIATTLSTHIT